MNGSWSDLEIFWINQRYLKLVSENGLIKTWLVSNSLEEYVWRARNFLWELYAVVLSMQNYCSIFNDSHQVLWYSIQYWYLVYIVKIFERVLRFCKSHIYIKSLWILLTCLVWYDLQMPPSFVLLHSFL